MAARRCAGAFVPALALFLVTVPASARAQIRQASGDIADLKTERILETAVKTPLGFPSVLPGARDAYVIVRAGAASLDVRVLARTSVAPEPIARQLHEELRGTELADAPVEWTKEDDYNCVHVASARGGIGRRFAASVLPVGQIVASVSRAGVVPHVCIRVPRYAKAQIGRLPSFTGDNYLWIDGSHALTDNTIRVSAQLGTKAIVLLSAFFGWVPLVTLLGFAVAIVVGTRPTIPIESRRHLYARFMRWPVFAAIALHAPFVILYFRSQYCQAVADIWFGSTSITVLSPLLFLPMPFILLALPIGRRIERRLFGPTDGDARINSVVSPQEKTHRIRVLRWSVLPLVAGAAVMILLPIAVKDARNPLSRFAFVIGIVIMQGGSALVRRAFRHESMQFSPTSEDTEVMRLAHQVGDRLGVPVKSVEVDESSAGRAYCAASVLLTGKVTVSRRLVNCCSAVELQFVLAHELAHIKKRHIQKRLAMLLAGTVAMMLPFLLLPLATITHARIANVAFLFPISMAGFAANFLLINGIRRRHEFEADRMALEAIGDATAARHALENMMRYSPLPHLHDIGDLSTHPAMSKRLSTLDEAARSLRIAL